MINAGFHLSIAKGMYNAPTEASVKGYLTFQSFVSSSRAWAPSKVSPDDAERFREASKGIEAFAHNPYLCNPSSPNDDVYSKSIAMLVDNMGTCEALGVKSLVVHIGSHLGKGERAGRERVIAAVQKALDQNSRTTVLLENSSGYTNSVGSEMKTIGELLDSIGSPRVGLCFDTCHAFAAGYDIRDKKGMESLETEISDYIGEKRLGLVHLNDAKFALGSGADRHWHIGEGEIGERGFANLFSCKVFRSGNFVMELPEDEVAGHTQDMLALGKIVRSAGLKLNGKD